MNKKLFLFINFLAVQNIKCPPIISFFFKPFPHVQQMTQQELQKKANKKSKKLQKAYKAPKYTLQFLDTNIAAGIYTTYTGQLVASDLNGQVTFLRKQEKPDINILITTKITPNIRTANTIHHWELELGTPAELYNIVRQENPDTQALFWSVTKQSLPSNNRIDLDTIVIFAKPKNIYVPTGITITGKSSHLTLPNFYVKKSINKEENSLYILQIKHFFGPIKKLFDKKPTFYQKHPH